MGFGRFDIGVTDCNCDCGAPPTCNATICVASSCNDGETFVAATGVTVTVTQGSTTIGSPITGVSGCVTLAIPGDGNFTIATSGNQRYVNTSLTTKLSCGQTVDISLDPAPGFLCLPCLAGEPISENLLISGGTGSITVPANELTGNFTLPATVPLLTTDVSGTCNGSVTANPCTTGSGTLDVQFEFGANPTACVDLEQQWSGATDCTGSGDDGVTCNPFEFYTANPAIGQFPQWGTPEACFGFCEQDSVEDMVAPVNNSVPLLIVLSFSSTGAPEGGTVANPPISTVTITEVL
jgi:hypothetical protein